jgi:hypothetical protein
MILIRQATLHHYDKTSTNIHELDLCQVDDNFYIINYIAKHHNNLKSGEVTTQDLPLEQAQKLFKNLDNFNSESLQIYILIELLKSQFSKIDKLVVLEKFQSKFSLEQLFSNLATRDIVQFFKSSCPIFREKAQQIFLKILPRLSDENEILETIELLNASHYDARKFALDIFKTELSINLFTPKIIATIFEIEHTRVRAFSLELLNQYFQYLNSTAIYNQSTYIQIIFDFIQILLTDKINTPFCTALSALLQENLSKWEKHINTKVIC